MAPQRDILDRMERAVEKVKDRMRRACMALSQANVPYALAGGNAVAAWVATVDEAAVRNTRDVDVLLQREDLDQAKQALAQAGFTYRHTTGLDMFMDGGQPSARDALRVVFGGEKMRPEYPLPAPSSSERVVLEESVSVLELEALVRMNENEADEFSTKRSGSCSGYDFRRPRDRGLVAKVS